MSAQPANEQLRLEVSRLIKAPRARVFAAWTDPGLIAKWFAPAPRHVSKAEADVRVGGRYSITMQGNDDAPTAIGEYVEVVEGRKLVFTWGWEGDPSRPTLVTVTFADAEGGTEVVLKHERFADAASRDMHREGWVGCLDSLKAYLTG